MLRYFFFLLPLLCVATANSQPIFRWPMEGTLGKDFFVVNYVDHDSAAGLLRDHHCGVQTYDGHQGTDIALPSFRQMDSGVTIVAAAPGRVFGVVDTAFDRNKVSVISRGFGNWIGIAHPGGIYSYYAHIRRGSATVNVGDSVQPGTPIALVGSAGNSTDPHLHFEVWNDSALIDPFAGPCNSTGSRWIAQPEYDTTFGVIHHGLLGWVPTLDTLREYPPRPNAPFSPLADTVITVWIHEYGVRAGDTSRIEWRRSTGELWYEWTFAHDAGYRYYYWWSYIATPPAGDWHVRYFLNNRLAASDSFSVQGLSSVAQPAAAGISVRYNASSHRVAVQLPEAVGIPVRLQLFDVAGSHIGTANAETDAAGVAQIELGSWDIPHGLYALQVVAGGKQFGCIINY
jgi:hypothetical protein